MGPRKRRRSINRSGSSKRVGSSGGLGRHNRAGSHSSTSQGDGSNGEPGGNGSEDENPELEEDGGHNSPIASPPISLTSILDLVPLQYHGYEIPGEFYSTALQWQQQMQLKDFTTHSLDDGENPVVRGVSVLWRFRVALNETPNPFAQATRAEALRCDTKIMQNGDRYRTMLAKGEWVRAVQHLFQDLWGNSEMDEHMAERQKRLYDHWCGTFAGDSLMALSAAIRNYEPNWTNDYSMYYSKSIPIIQSSGMGKSRLADEMGKTNFQFAFVFRSYGDTGYPPGDPEIIDYFRRRDHEPSILVAAFYAALGTIGETHVHPDFREQ